MVTFHQAYTLADMQQNSKHFILASKIVSPHEFRTHNFRSNYKNFNGPLRRDCEELLRIQDFLPYTACLFSALAYSSEIALSHLSLNSVIPWSSTRIATWRLQAYCRWVRRPPRAFTVVNEKSECYDYIVVFYDRLKVCAVGELLFNCCSRIIEGKIASDTSGFTRIPLLHHLSEHTGLQSLGSVGLSISKDEFVNSI